jgi:AraC-like DNA-binding protein
MHANSTFPTTDFPAGTPAPGVALTRGLRGYETAIKEAYAPMVVAPEVPDANYAWAVRGKRCGVLGMSHIAANGEIRARVEHAAEHPSTRRVLLTFVERGSFEFAQAGRHAVCGPQSLVLMDVGRPLEAAQRGALEILSCILPADFLQARVPALPRVLTSPRPATRGAAAMLRDVMRSGWRESDGLDADEARALPGIFCTLIDSVFVRDDQTPARHDSQLAALHQRMLDIIHEQAHDPRLTPARVAERMGISSSYLFTVARRFGSSVRKSIIEHRLEGARQMLSDPACARRSVTEIAFLWGFQDAAHFSRRFSARFGASPRAYRECCTGSSLPRA